MTQLLTYLVRSFGARPYLVLSAAAMLAAIGGTFGLKVKVNAGNEALFLRNDPAVLAHQVFNDTFGGDNVVVVALSGPVFTEDGLARLDDMTHAIRETEGVALAESITTVKNVYQGPLELYGWSPYEWFLDGDNSLEQYRSEILGEPLFADHLVSRDGRMAAVVVTLARSTKAIVDAIREVADRQGGAGFTTHVAGFPVAHHDFSSMIEADRSRFIPLVVLAIAIIALVLFRHPWGMLLPLGCVGLSVLLTTGMAGVLGVDENMVTSLLVPVIMVVSVTVAVNVCIVYGWERGRLGPGVPAIVAAYAKIGPACLFTTLTTVVGFASLAMSPVPAIAEFGGLCAFGTACSFLSALLLLPAAMALPWRWGPRSLRTPAREQGRSWQHVSSCLYSHPLVALLGVLCLAAVLASGIRQLRVETDVVGQLPKGSRLATDTRVLDAGLGGVNTCDVLLTAPAGTFARRPALDALSTVQDKLSAMVDRGVTSSLSIADLIKRMHAAKSGEETLPRAMPTDATLLAYYFGVLARAGKETPAAQLVSADGSHARLNVRMRELASPQAYALVQEIAQLATDAMPKTVSIQPTGQFVLLQNMTHALPRQQLRSIVVAGALIIAMIGLLFRSLRYALLASVVAALPIVSIYGVMGWLAVPLSTATSMIAVVVLGLAVDAAILLIARYKEALATGRCGQEAIALMLGRAGPAVLVSNVVLIAGFGICGTSPFAPIRDFGLLTAVTMALSLATALTVLPALLSVVNAKGEG